MNQAIDAQGLLQQAGEARSRVLVITLPMPGTLLTVNVRQKLHWRTQGAIAKQQRHDAMLCAYGALSAHPDTLTRPLFPIGAVRVDMDFYRRPYQKVCDETGAVEAAKPWLDGCEDAQVFTDDKQCTIGAVRWHPTDPEPRIEITLTGVD